MFRQKCYAAGRLLLDADQNIMPYNNFIQMFSYKFNETLTDRLIKTMKHAIEVSKDISKNKRQITENKIK